MEKGKFFQNGSILGYDKVGDEMVINEEQAATVRMIFELYNSGLGVRKIQWELEKAGRLTAKGLKNWSASNISRILHNSFYCGIITYNKEYVADFLEQKKIVNKGEREQLVVDGSHSPIISKEDFEKAQARLEEIIEAYVEYIVVDKDTFYWKFRHFNEPIGANIQGRKNKFSVESQLDNADSATGENTPLFATRGTGGDSTKVVH